MAGLAPASGLRTKDSPVMTNLWLPDGAPLVGLPRLQTQMHAKMEFISYHNGSRQTPQERVESVLKKDVKVEEADLEDLSIVSEEPLENPWVAKGRELKVYVYTLPDHLHFAYDDGKSAQDFFYDRAISHLFKTSAQRVDDPKTADFFFVDLNLPEIFNYGLHHGRARPRNVDTDTVSVMRAVGPYWDTKRSRHIVMTRRCPGSKFGMDVHGFEELLKNDTLALCVEASADDREPECRTGEVRRNLHIGYYVQALDPLRRLPLKPVNRPMLATYLGADINTQRKAVRAWMNHSSDCTAFVVGTHALPGKIVDGTIADYHTLLAHSRFGVEPFGDTYERMSRDANWALGAVPVIFDYLETPKQFLPWQPIVNWSSFSVTFGLSKEESDGHADFTPRLEKTLRHLVASGEADRLYAGLLRARRLLRWTHEGVFSTIMGMLAHHLEEEGHVANLANCTKGRAEGRAERRPTRGPRRLARHFAWWHR